MTDNEIIKALECCSTKIRCGGCPYFDKFNIADSSCLDDIAKDALDLIKRQQAEIEKYKELEEQNRLIELPCKVGTVLFFFGKNTDGIDVIDSTEMFSIDQCLNIGQHIGHGFYLTKEEAEAKLKERVGANNEL